MKEVLGGGGNNMSTYKILIIDDDPIILEDILSMIDWKKEGFDVITAINGEQGLQKTLSYVPDIIFTDVRMPYMDGLSMVKEIKKTGVTAKILMLSAYGEFSYAREAIQFGVSEYILKPELSETVLLEKLTRIRAQLDGTEKSPQFIKERQKENYSPIINSVVEYIHGHYNEVTLKNNQIADYIALSSGRLCVRFKEEVGQTISDYITDVRIAHAKDLLESGKYKVYEVSSLVGFSSSTYFSSVFHKRTGIAPTQYTGDDKHEA